VAVEFVAGASGDILVVEDDADTRAVVTHALTRAGYQVRAVGTAQEGLTWLTERQGDVDLVLTDIALPDMTGFAFAGAIADRIAPLRILYMSGYAREHIAGAPAGFDPAADLLIKPFSTEKLLAAVRFTLERTRGRVSGPEAGPET
jgi:DNA-binding response OmpR family regulator